MFDDLFDSPWKILIVAVVVLVLFGSKKLPDAARSLGKSMRILKTEMQGLNEDEPAAPVSAGTADPQAQIAALQEQIDSLQRSVAANGAVATPSPSREATR